MTRSRDSERDFLSRWSRLKQDARAEPEPAPEPPAEAAADPAPEKSEAEILEELGLPDPDTLGPGSDFKAFMAEAVPDWLRRRALRRLWTSNPALANLDMLVDYGEDYTDAATTVANLQSAYKAGRGYFDKLTKQKEMAEAAGEEEAHASRSLAGESPERDEAADASVAGGDTERAAGEPEAPGEAEAPPSEAPPEADGPQIAREASASSPPRRRRMRFDFDES